MPARNARAKKKTRDDAMLETRAALIDAALELFAKDGLDASLDAICEHAGFTRGAFYVHFADRDALLVAVMEKVGAQFLARMFASAEAGAARDRASTRLAGAEAGAARDRASTRSAGAEAGAPRDRASVAEARDSADGGALEQAAARFVGAVGAGDYPLMAPAAAAPQIKFHQLLDACARSPTVRAQYRALVEASVEHVASLALLDRVSGAIRADLDPTELGKAMLATIIGAQTMAELGVPIDAAALARTVLSALKPTARR